MLVLVSVKCVVLSLIGRKLFLEPREGAVFVLRPVTGVRVNSPRRPPPDRQAVTGLTFFLNGFVASWVVFFMATFYVFRVNYFFKYFIPSSTDGVL